MSLASILRSLGGRDVPVYRPRTRRFEAEMPDLPEDMAGEQDYDPQDLDPTQGIGRSEDLYQTKQGPRKMTPISEDIEETGPPETAFVERKPREWVQRLKQELPNIVRGGIVAASSPTRGQVGTAGDIFGSLRAVMDDRQQQDILSHNMRRQAAKDAQDAEYNQARIGEQRARAQMEQARAQDYANGRGRNPQNLQESIAEQEKILGRPLTEREKQTVLRLYGPQYDARNLDQIMGREGKTSEQIIEAKRKAAEDSARLRNSNLEQGSMRLISEYDGKIAKAQSEEEVAALVKERDAKLATISNQKQALSPKRSPFLPKKFVSADGTVLVDEVDAEGKPTGAGVPWKMKMGDKLEPVKAPVKTPSSSRSRLKERILENGNIGIVNLDTGGVTDTGKKAGATPRAASATDEKFGLLADALGVKRPGAGTTATTSNPPSVQPKTGPPLINPADIRKKLAARKNVPESAITTEEIEAVVRIATANAKKK